MVSVDQDQVDIMEMPEDNKDCVFDSQLTSASQSSDCYDSLNDMSSSSSVSFLDCLRAPH